MEISASRLRCASGPDADLTTSLLASLAHLVRVTEWLRAHLLDHLGVREGAVCVDVFLVILNLLDQAGRRLQPLEAFVDAHLGRLDALVQRLPQLQNFHRPGEAQGQVVRGHDEGKEAVDAARAHLPKCLRLFVACVGRHIQCGIVEGE
eukprot:CAMPEP_0170371908 /NCGR_PEP_ID=MMETSP0117_2-20130122/9277_1 /TAXON_ID=400756 /ORGANISM="Durinskia baltica, Strain CSIRO CS-38" /LENGTH=148 /DNA_ID=CAMNT_0010626745 /DNA_START=194 /DNA_END=637 /DNA_ORIENTATION=+